MDDNQSFSVYVIVAGIVVLVLFGGKGLIGAYKYSSCIEHHTPAECGVKK